MRWWFQLQWEAANDACLHQQWHRRGRLLRRRESRCEGNIGSETIASLKPAKPFLCKKQLQRLVETTSAETAALAHVPCPLSELSYGLVVLNILLVCTLKRCCIPRLQDACSITNRLLRTGGNVERKGWPIRKMEMRRQPSVHDVWTDKLRPWF